MDNSKWAIFTDLHLGVHQNSSTWHKIAFNWADWFVEELHKEGIDKIIFAGDFFHSRSEISVSTIHAASELLSKFKDFNIYMVVGNHDSYYKEKPDVNSLSILKGYSNIRIFDSTSTITINNKKATFCPWGATYEDIPNSDVLFGHFEIESFKMNAHKLCEGGIRPADLLKKSSLIFSGHFHLNDERVYDGGSIIYIGSPFQLDFGDRETRKGYYILDFDTLNYTFKGNDLTPKHKKIKLSNILNGGQITDDYANEIPGNFIRLVVDSRVEQKNLDSIIHKVNGLSPLSFTVDPLVNYELLPEQENTDLSGVDISKAIVEFVNLLDIPEKEEVTKHTLYLYNQALKHG